MKSKVKRVFSFILAMMTAAVFGVSASAASIDVTGGEEGQEYSAYKIFDVVASTASGGSYSYTIDSSSQWFAAVQAYAATTGSGLTLTQVGTSTTYNVTTTSDYDATAFSEFLQQELEDQVYNASGYTADQTAVASLPTGGSLVTATLDNLDAGYYLVTTNLGSLCILNTTVSNVSISEKNDEPSVDKSVTGATATPSASIGDTVSYTLTINVGAGYTGDNFTVVDTLPNGLTYTDSSVVVTGYHTTDDGQNYTSTVWTAGASDDYTIDSTNPLTITLLASGDLSGLTSKYDYITITYDTVLNSLANIDNYNTTVGNTNNVTITYGDNQTMTAEEKVYTYRFGIQKTDDYNNQLSGAEFKITDSSGNTLYWVQTTGANPYYNYYRLATAEEVANYYNYSANPNYTPAPTSVVYETITSNENYEQFYLEGLAAGTYYVTEVTAPSGYTILTDSITVVISDSGALSATYGGTGTVNYSNDYLTVINSTGTAMPTTGGIGTTIFYIVGGVLMCGAAVVLITRRRMNGSEK